MDVYYVLYAFWVGTSPVLSWRGEGIRTLLKLERELELGVLAIGFGYYPLPILNR